MTAKMVEPRRTPDPTVGASVPPIAFGPVRSRRLGWSLGVNNVPAKTCTYACVYCQVGATDRARLEREAFFEPGQIVDAVRERVDACRSSGQVIDFVTFVPDGEPTLDLHLGEEIRSVAGLGQRVAVLTNGSLLWREDVRNELMPAALVSLKVDTVDDATWRDLDRPIGNLDLWTILDGMERFAADFGGDLVTETMLVAGVNDDEASARQTAAFVSALAPLRAYVAIPTRPPAETWVRAPSRNVVDRVAKAFRRAGIPAVCLIEEDDAPFAAAVGDPVRGLLGIAAVHPMTVAAAHDYLDRSGADRSAIQVLLDAGQLEIVRHGDAAYIRARHRCPAMELGAGHAGAPHDSGEVEPPTRTPAGRPASDKEAHP